MPIYIEDVETARLLNELARLQNKNETAVLRDLLRAEIDRLRRVTTPDERLRAMQIVIDSLPPTRKRVNRKDFDSLYTYLTGN